MQGVAIVTDSTADIPSDLVEELGILVTPARVIINGKEYRDKVDISSEEFYRLLPTLNPLPTTSGVTVEDFLAAFRQGLEGAGHVLCLLLPRGFSQMTLSAAHMARQMLAEEDISVVDTRTGLAGQALIVLMAAKAVQQGASKEAVLALVNELIPKVRTIFTADTLEYLRKGGRLSAPQALLGAMLNVKPILHIHEGRAVPIGRERSRPKAKAHLLRLIEEAVGEGAEVNAAIMHAMAREEAEELRDRIAARFHCQDLYILDNIGPTVGAHMGPGALGVGFCAV
jgi:DegV family protein with EDD domain